MPQSPEFAPGGQYDFWGQYQARQAQQQMFAASTAQARQQQQAQAQAQQRWTQVWGTVQPWLEQWNTDWQAAGQEARADRTDMLGRIEEFTNGLNDTWANGIVDQVRKFWEGKTNQTVQAVMTQQAAMGRTASPYLLAEVRRRMWSQQSDAIQVQRWEVERERRAAMEWALGMRDQVYQGTQRNMADPSSVLQILSQLGAGATGITA